MNSRLTHAMACMGFFMVGILLTGCQPNSYLLEPTVIYWPQQRHIDQLPSAFPELSEEERQTDWGKELVIGETMAKELDLYRAITAFKRARILIPACEVCRINQIEYGIFLSYYLGQRYSEAVLTFESSSLCSVTGHFPALRELLCALYDAYLHDKKPEKACRLLGLIEKIDQGMSVTLQLSEAIRVGDLSGALEMAPCSPFSDRIFEFAGNFECRKLSVCKAQTLNALLPGAGYYYVGQCKAAVTSFVINTLFTAAAYQLFHRGYWAPGLITASLEVGWYVGGINGAGLAAKQFNETLYSDLAKETMVCNGMFPVLLFSTSF